MKYASVCSGVEAASLAWMPLGWEAAWFSEIEPFPCAVLKERFPNVPNLGDMTKIKVENLQNGDQKYYGADGTDVIVSGGIDLLVGGTPCQGFSVAGKQGGANDLRSALCFTYIKLLESMRPRWFVWENVPGVFSTNGGNDFKEFIRKIDEVGYHVAWRVLDAQYVRVDGYPRAVPQRRRRVFVVGHLGGWEYPATVLFEPDCLFGNNPPRRVKGKGFTANSERSITSAKSIWTFASSCHGGFATTKAAGSLKASGGDINGGSENLSVFWNGEDVSTTITEAFADDRMPDKGKLPCVLCLNDQGGSVMQIENDGNAGTLRANTHGNEQIVCVSNGENISDTLDASYYKGVGSRNGKERTYVCFAVNGAETPIYNIECANVVNCSHNGAENSILCRATQQGNAETMLECCPTITEAAGTSGNNQPICFASSGFGQKIESDVASTLSTDHDDRVTGNNEALIQEQVGYYPSQHQTPKKSDTVTLTTGNCNTFAIAENIIGRKVENGGNGVGAQSELSYTQNTSGVMGVSNNSMIRRLLPIECERLMGFPDNWTRIPCKGKTEEECPDSPRYKACGNSMCVNVMRWLGMRIENVERKMRNG